MHAKRTHGCLTSQLHISTLQKRKLRPDFSTVTRRDRDGEREMERANSDTESSDESEALGPTRVVDVPVPRR